jgi:N-acetylglutamate synthase-like GNAT family acetyltransferase
MTGAEDNERPAYEVRRATLEDLPQLKLLWEQARLPVAELEKRFTEFQLAFTLDGRLVGSLGLQMFKQQGYIHSEAFTDPRFGPEVRPLLWQRLLTVAKNNGLVRLWTLPTTAFYREQGMIDVDETTRPKIPEIFGNGNADWVTLKLKEENQSAISLEKEFEIFAEAQRNESERVMNQAKALRLLAYGLLILALMALGALAVVFGKLRRRR